MNRKQLISFPFLYVYKHTQYIGVSVQRLLTASPKTSGCPRQDIVERERERGRGKDEVGPVEQLLSLSLSFFLPSHGGKGARRTLDSRFINEII